MTLFYAEGCDILSIGERISSLRKQKNISQIQLAAALDISRQAVSKWETDQSAPDTKNLIRLADLLDTDLEYLSSGRKSPSPPLSPPRVIRVVEQVEKPVEVEKIIEKVIEKPVLVEKIVEIPVEKQVVRKVHRTKYVRNPLEFFVCGIVCFLLGLLIGFFL